MHHLILACRDLDQDDFAEARRIDGFIVATNGMLAVWEKSDEPAPPWPERMAGPLSKFIYAKEWDDIGQVDAVPSPEKVECSVCTSGRTRERVTCAACDGDGTCTHCDGICGRCDGGGKVDGPATITCPTCAGTSKVNPAIMLVEVHSGRSTIIFDWMKLPGLPVGTLYGIGPRESLLWQTPDGVRGLLMRMDTVSRAPDAVINTTQKELTHGSL